MARIIFLVPLLMSLIGSAFGAIVPYFQADGMVDYNNPQAPKAVGLQAFSFEGETPSSTNNVPGRPSLDDFSFTRNLDGNSPVFFQYMTTGKPFPTFIVTVTQTATPTPFVVAVYTFNQAYVTSQTISWSSGSPVEKITLQYAKLTMTYNQQNADGSKGLTTTASFNRVTGAPGRRSISFEG